MQVVVFCKYINFVEQRLKFSHFESSIIPYLIKNQCSHHIETSQMICNANQLSGFHVMENIGR